MTGPRRCAAAAWPSAAAKVSPPIGPPRSDGNSDRAGQLPVVGELAADVGHPPDQQRPGVAEHRHHPLPRPGSARALAQPDVDLAQRAVAEVQVLQPQPAQLPQPQPGLGGQPGHRVVPGGGQPLARRGQLARARRRRTPPARPATAGRGRGSRRMAGPVALIDRGGDHPAGQLVDLAPVAGLQEPEEQVDRPGLAAPGLRRLVPLLLAQEPVGVRGLDLPREHARMLQELLHRGDLAADRAVGHAVGQPGQHVLGHQVLLVGRGLTRPVQRPRGPQVPDHSQRHAAPRLQQSRTRLAIAEDCTGMPTPIQGSASDTPSGVSCHLTCDKRRPCPSESQNELSAGPALDGRSVRPARPARHRARRAAGRGHLARRYRLHPDPHLRRHPRHRTRHQERRRRAPVLPGLHPRPWTGHWSAMPADFTPRSYHNHAGRR